MPTSTIPSPSLGPVNLITVARDFGSRGSTFGAALGTALGWPVLDRQIIGIVADRLRLGRDDINWLDEHSPRLRDWIARSLLYGPPELPITLESADMVDPDLVARTAREVILEAAAVPPLIVVGHGAQCLLAGREGAMHIRLFAPLHVRIARLMAERGWDEATATTQAHRMDEERTRYVRHYYGHDRYDPLLFDLQLNSGRFSIQQAVAVTMATIGSTTGV